MDLQKKPHLVASAAMVLIFTVEAAASGEAVAATSPISKHRFTTEEITVDTGWRVHVQ